MRAYICTKCSTPCYLIDVNSVSGIEPDTCPYRSDANWNEVNINLGPIEDQLDGGGFNK